MSFLRLLPVLLSFLLIAAHFYRGGNLAMVLVGLVLPLLLLIPRRWVPPVVTVGLFLAALEWLHTLSAIAGLRMQMGLPWVRMAVILGAVALFTALSALVFRSRSLRNRYAVPASAE